MRLGDRLRQARESARLSQVQVKGYTGINNKTLSNYEKNVSSPDPYTLKTLADLYGVTTDWLISGEQPDFQKSTLCISSEDLHLLEILKELSLEKRKAIETLLSDTDNSTTEKK